jgi:dienelactone hydrolase
MRALSWLLSIILHTTLFVVLLHAARLAPLELAEVMELDLTEMETPEIVAPLPVPKPIQATPVPQPETGPVAATPLPQDKTIVMADEPVQPAEALPAEPPAPEPGVVEISPVKVPVQEPPESTDKPRRVVVRKNDVIVHRGHEARFGRSMMGDYYSYSASEFSGHFKTKDDRTISIIDARNTKYGRFLIYDSKNKTLRRLKQFGKYVYTIGPSVHADQPITGTVTFLAKNDRIERFILITDDDRIAHYPTKVHVRESDVTIPDSGLAGRTTLPPSGTGHPGVVFVWGNQCVEPGMVQGFTRSLGMHGLASLTFSPRGCDGADGTPAGDDALIRDTLAALGYFAALPQTGPGRTGIWGSGPGVTAAVAAATAPKLSHPPFLVCLLGDSVRPQALPDRAALARLHMPVLWLITGRDTARLDGFRTTLETLRDKGGRPFTIVVAPLGAGPEVEQAQTALSGWVEQVADDHAKLAASWIRSLP